MANTIDKILIVGHSILESAAKEELAEKCLQNSVQIQLFNSADTHIEKILSSRSSYDSSDACQSSPDNFVTKHNTDIDQQLAGALIQEFEFVHERNVESSLFHDNFHINHLLWKELQTCLINWKIDSIVFLNFPQNLQEAVLYQIATALNKKTILFNQSVFVNRYFSCYSIVDFGNRFSNTSIDKQVLTPRIKEHNFEIRTSETAPCPGSSIKDVLQIYAFLLKIISFKVFDPFFGRKLAKHIHDAPSDISKWNDPFSKFFNCKRYAYLEFLTHIKYETVDPQQRYIFFPLQSQRELISEILTNRFSDQLLAIENLARITPSDCYIFVKGNSTDCLDVVTPMFFHRIKRISKVIYLPSCTNVDDLICRSDFIATVNSSLGWDALCQGKTVLTFGRPWYRKLPGVVTYKDDIEFDEISKLKFNQSELETQVDLLYSKAHIGNLKQPSSGKHSKSSPQLNGSNIAQTILDLICDKIEVTFPKSTIPPDESEI